MRDSGQPEDTITKALRNDDVDTVQSIISKTYFDFQGTFIPFNIFESYLPNGQKNYMNYAAAYGSFKCFKYFLLNHYSPDEEILKITGL